MRLTAFTLPHTLFPLEAQSRRQQLENALEPYLNFVEARAADRTDLERVHTPEYLEKLFGPGLNRQEALRLGFPWTPEVLTRALHSTGGTVQATEYALEHGLGPHLGGGTHHAYPDHAEGYSLFNDVAVAVAKLRARGDFRRVLTVDLDVHQGNGTAACLERDPYCFTLSMHGANNYPFVKAKSSLDVELPDDTLDAAYLEYLNPALERAFAFRPQLVFYIAGIDVLGGDRKGRVRLTLEGLRSREAHVYARVKKAGAALVVVLGGSYNRDFELSLSARVQTYRMAVEMLGRFP